MSSDLQIFEVKILYTSYDLSFIRTCSPMQLVNIVRKAFYLAYTFTYDDELPFVPSNINCFNVCQSVHLQCLAIIMLHSYRDFGDITSDINLFSILSGECKSYLKYIMNDNSDFFTDPYYPSVEQFHEYYLKFISGHDYECFDYVKNLCGNVEIPFPD